MELLADDGALTQFMSDFPHADAGKLRTLIRNTKKSRSKTNHQKFPRPVSRVENRDGKRGRGNLGIFSDDIRRYLDWRIKCCSVKRPPPFWRQP